ncbi:hypothetical protein [Sorangium sp. So ce1000]|uniref:hypothetical protein n=1 Tax=Sorangium sp. So ce1000 TaxID=3133325 RepID=UPI003F5FE122
MLDELVAEICARQSPGGAFLSTVRLPFGEVEDLNCFVTGLVLRELAPVRGCSPIDEARRRALGFLLRSKYPAYPYLFSFYPHRAHPFWMRSALYADADDTSVIVSELVRAGRLPTESLTYVAQNYLLRYRAVGDFSRHLTQPWQREGVFLTWLTSADIENPIDCCVNTNVVGLLAGAGLRGMNGYDAACAMIHEAAEQAAERPESARRFTPYYPHPAEWRRALERAVEAGARELTSALEALRAAAPAWEETHGVTPLCSDAGGGIVWTAEVLTFARRLRERTASGG